ncbi:MAG: LysR substrate-binding domain-containing protein [Rhizobiaceae bacterium]
MRYVQLRAFHHVASQGSFSRAAESLHLTQPAISDQVRKLESEYDVRLFNRAKKQIAVTPEGEKLFEITRRMFEVEGQALEFLTETRSVKTGQLNIMADSTHHVIDILEPFRQKHPSVFVSLRGGNTKAIVASLLNYDADIGVLGDLPESRDFDVIKLNSTPLVAFAASSGKFGQMNDIPFDKLAALPLVMREPGSMTRAKLEEHARKVGVKLKTQIEVEGREAVVEVVASSDTIGVVSQAEFSNDPRLVQIPITGVELTMDEALVCLRERKESLLIRTFMTAARMSVGVVGG